MTTITTMILLAVLALIGIVTLCATYIEVGKIRRQGEAVGALENSLEKLRRMLRDQGVRTGFTLVETLAEKEIPRLVTGDELERLTDRLTLLEELFLRPVTLRPVEPVDEELYRRDEG